MGYYIHEEYYTATHVPYYYSKVLCQTCAYSKLKSSADDAVLLHNQQGTADYKKAFEEFDILHYQHDPQVTVSRDDFLANHRDHAIGATFNSDAGWRVWEHVRGYCVECKDFCYPKQYFCTCEKHSRLSGRHGICPDCGKCAYEPANEKCEHNKILLFKTFRAKATTIYYCFRCRGFLSQDEIRAAQDDGQPVCMDHISEWNDDQSVFVFHFTRCHRNEERGGIKIGYEPYTDLSDLADEYDNRLEGDFEITSEP